MVHMIIISFSSKWLEDIRNSIVALKMLVLFFNKAVESIKKCSNYVIILIQNAAFDTVNAGKENVVFVFVIGAVDYEMICCFCF